jgi:hypothetical protein
MPPEDAAGTYEFEAFLIDPISSSALLFSASAP